MLEIECPYCGPRDEFEFQYGGTAGIVRPASDADEAEWANYLYFRDNPKGPHFELWCHRFGCRQWLELERCTLTHAIGAIRAVREVEPNRLARGGSGPHE